MCCSQVVRIAGSFAPHLPDVGGMHCVKLERVQKSVAYMEPIKTLCQTGYSSLKGCHAHAPKRELGAVGLHIGLDTRKNSPSA